MRERDWQGILRECGINRRLDSAEPVAGGGAWRLRLNDGASLFLKSLPADNTGILAAEVDGLAALRETGTVRVPAVYGQGQSTACAWLLCEYLSLRTPDEASERRLGEALAALHACHGKRHGWHQDNWIGDSPQPNDPDSDWVRFFCERRLGYQLQLARQNGFGGRLQAQGATLLETLPRLLAGHEPAPSLLHGDLWSGNRAALADGSPVIYDPAVHYGDAECDLAMSELFGRFHNAFYQAYQHHHPLDAGYHEIRRPLYQLYHVLNHLNLFGAGFARQAEALMETLLTCARD